MRDTVGVLGASDAQDKVPGVSVKTSSLYDIRREERCRGAH